MRIGTISKLDLLKAPKGHMPVISGCGFHKNKKRDKKARRLADKRVTNENMG